DEMELHRLARLLRDVAQVTLVPSGQDDAMDPGAVRGEDLLLHAADLEHLPPQRYFARHGDVVPDGAVRERGGDGEGDGDPGGGAGRRNRADGEVDVDVVVLERALGDVELVAAAADVRVGGVDGLAHDVAEEPGDDEAAAAGHLERLDEHDL